ncbi:MAG: magnesium transporter CorA family protein [Bacteroidota bacterium]|nr:magnesium transporter CorA family protein [Bacteroidota bacterium]
MFDVVKIGNIRWYHSNEASEENLQFLIDEFHFHHLDIEDCRTVNQRSKIDVYDDYYFLILHFPNLDKSQSFVRTREVKIFWGEDYMITIGKTHWTVDETFEKAKNQEENKEEFLIGTSDALLYELLDRLMKESLTLIKRLGSVVELISRQMFEKRAERTIELMSVTRKNLILLNTIFKPQLRLFTRLESGEIEGYAENMEEYWGNILDYYQKVWDLTEDYDELIAGLSRTFDSLLSNRTNEIMKMLTLISSIILPLTFITGLYGMNIGLPYQGSPYAFLVIGGFMAVIVVFMVFVFKKRRWM